MNRKKELKTLIEAMEEKMKGFRDNERNVIASMEIDLINTFQDLAKNNLGENLDGGISLRFDKNSIVPHIEGCTWEDVCRIHNYHCWDTNKKEIEFEISYGATGYSQKADRINLTKMRMLGEVFTELDKFVRKEKSAFDTFKRVFETFEEMDNQRYDTEEALKDYKGELNNIKHQEVVEAVIKRGEIVFPHTDKFYIRNSSHRSSVDKVVIDKITDKSITMSYYRKDSSGELRLQDTYRQKIGEGRSNLYNFQKRSEELLEKMLEEASAEKA